MSTANNRTPSANGQGRKSRGKVRPELMGDVEAARVILRVARTRQEATADEIARLTPAWADAEILARDGDDKIGYWLGRCRERAGADAAKLAVVDRLRDAIEQARAEPPAEPSVPEHRLKVVRGHDDQADADGAVFANFRGHGDDRTALRPADLDEDRRAIIGEWPKRVGSMLFYEGIDGRPVDLKSTPQLIAYLRRAADVHWTKGTIFVTQEQYFEHLRQVAEPCDGVEVLPHWPPIPGMHYMHPPIPPISESGRLTELVSMFSAASEEDKSLPRLPRYLLVWLVDLFDFVYLFTHSLTNSDERQPGIGDATGLALVGTRGQSIGAGDDPPRRVRDDSSASW